MRGFLKEREESPLECAVGGGWPRVGGLRDLVVHSGFGFAFITGSVVGKSRPAYGVTEWPRDRGGRVQGLGTPAVVKQDWFEIKPFKLTSCVTLVKWFNLLSHL